MPAARPRGRMVTPSGGKPFVQFYQERAVTEYEDHVAGWVRKQVVEMDVTGPAAETLTLPFEQHAVVAIIRFNMHKPVSYPKRVTVHTRKPDLDNLVKTVLDGLVKARVLKDDTFVWRIDMQKGYADEQHPTGVEIDLTAVVAEMP